MREHVIYLHTNTINGKGYVGKTRVGMNKRWKQHVYESKRGSETAFHRAIRKYGAAAFSHQELCRVSCSLSANIAEVAWIFVLETMGRGYNVTIGGDGGSPFLGRHHTEDAKRKISDAQTGEKSHMWGKSLPDDVKARIGSAHIGNKYAMGHRHTEEFKDRIREINMGNTNSLGHKHSEETRAKMRASKIGHEVTADCRKKMSERARERYSSEFERNRQRESSFRVWAKRREDNAVPLPMLEGAQ